MFYFWILFNLFALGMLALDLRVFHRPGHVVSFRESLGWSADVRGVGCGASRSFCISGKVIRPRWSLLPDMFSSFRSASITCSSFS